MLPPCTESAYVVVAALHHPFFEHSTTQHRPVFVPPTLVRVLHVARNPRRSMIDTGSFVSVREAAAKKQREVEGCGIVGLCNFCILRNINRSCSCIRLCSGRPSRRATWPQNGSSKTIYGAATKLPRRSLPHAATGTCCSSCDQGRSSGCQRAAQQCRGVALPQSVSQPSRNGRGLWCQCNSHLIENLGTSLWCGPS